MPATKTARRTINMTPQLQARLRQMAETGPRSITEADLIRQAIREFLDRQEDITGSRAHFRKTFWYGRIPGTPVHRAAVPQIQVPKLTIATSEIDHHNFRN